MKLQLDKLKCREEGKKIINTYGSPIRLCFAINRICVSRLLTRFHCKLRNYHNLNRIATIILYSTYYTTHINRRAGDIHTHRTILILITNLITY